MKAKWSFSGDFLARIMASIVTHRVSMKTWSVPAVQSAVHVDKGSIVGYEKGDFWADGVKRVYRLIV